MPVGSLIHLADQRRYALNSPVAITTVRNFNGTVTCGTGNDRVLREMSVARYHGH